MSTKKQQEVAVQEEQANAIALYEDAGETGFEDTSGDDFAIPFLKLLQKGSPEVDEDDGAYIEGAKPGMFLNTGTMELIESPVVIPCAYKHAMVEWKPNQGGYVAQHEPGYEVGMPRRKRDDGSESGVFVNDTGNDVVDTRYWFCLLDSPDGLTPVIISLSSTQIKKSRQWMTRLQSMKTPGGKTYPMYAHRWAMSSVPEDNEHGSWRGWKIEKKDLITDRATFTQCVEAREMFKGFTDNVKPPEQPAAADSETGEGDDIPF